MEIIRHKIMILMIQLVAPFALIGQSSEGDALLVKRVFDEVLTHGECHENLRYICKEIGHRLSGSDNYDKAALYCQGLLEDLLVPTTLQSTTVLTWERGAKEKCILTISDQQQVEVDILALGMSEGGPVGGLFGEVIEVKSLDEVRTLGAAAISGKIVFYNRPMEVTQVNVFRAYGGAVDQRVYGATVAAEFGAIASITRSMAIGINDIPHTGTLAYRDEFAKIPGVAISTLDAEMLSKELGKGKVTAKLEVYSKTTGEGNAHTVIGEIRGSEFPDEIILVGGHLDSWDVGEGAHDDGTGVVQSIEVIRTLKALKYTPKRTIRCVLFANEENGLSGGITYAEQSNKNGEYHLMALESDAGGFIPKEISFEGDTSTFKNLYRAISTYADIFEAYGILFSNGGSGADIGPLKSQKGLLAGLRPDSQRYFDLHHTQDDVWEQVHERELKMGAAAMTSLVLLVDQHGLQNK